MRATPPLFGAMCIARMASALVYVCYREEEWLYICCREEERYAGRRYQLRAEHALEESTLAALHGDDFP